MQEPNIEVTIAAPNVALVTLDRPPVNALGREIREAMLRVFDRLEGDAEVRAIVLTAKGHIFCAGADIKEKQALAGAEGDYVRANRLTRDVFFALVDSSKPVIAAVNGAALGAGFVLAACADMIVAADTAVFGMPEIDVGQGGGASVLQRILPPSKVRRMMLTGEHVPAGELYRLGAVEACLPMAELVPAALAFASTDGGEKSDRDPTPPWFILRGGGAGYPRRISPGARLHHGTRDLCRRRGSPASVL